MASSVLMFKALLALGLTATSAWLVQPMPSGAARQVVGQAAEACRSVRMQESGDAEAFTEDLLDALAADEPMGDSTPSGTFVSADGDATRLGAICVCRLEPGPHTVPGSARQYHRRSVPLHMRHGK